MALFLWGFAAVWLTLLAAMTYVVARDGPPAGTSASTIVVILGTLWLFGVGLVAFVSTKPCFFVSVDHANRVSAAWRYPHKVVRKELRTASVRPAAVIESQDSEGGPYFYARVQTTAGESIDIAEGHDRSACEQACERFNRALRQGGWRPEP